MNGSEKVAAAAERLGQTANENGGPYIEPENYRGSVARTMFDRPGSEDGTIIALVPEHHIGEVSREAFVRIASIHLRTKQVKAEYLGVVASGPFAEPDALGAAAPTLVVAAAHGAALTPKYHGIAQINVFGERVEGMIIPPLRRPCPNSPVFLLEDDDVKGIIGLDIAPEDKPVRLGLMDGANSLAIELPAARKSVLYKHMAILDTTGGGKSTTVSGAIMNFAEAATLSWSLTSKANTRRSIRPPHHARQVELEDCHHRIVGTHARLASRFHRPTIRYKRHTAIHPPSSMSSCTSNTSNGLAGELIRS